MKQLYVCTHFLQIHVHDKLTELHKFLRDVNRYLDAAVEKEKTVKELKAEKRGYEEAYGRERRKVDLKLKEIVREMVDKKKDERERERGRGRENIELIRCIKDEGKEKGNVKGKMVDEEENKEESDHMKEVRRFVMELMDRSPQIHSIFDLSPLLSIVMLLQVRTSLLFSSCNSHCLDLF